MTLRFVGLQQPFFFFLFFPLNLLIKIVSESSNKQNNKRTKNYCMCKVTMGLEKSHNQKWC